MGVTNNWLYRATDEEHEVICEAVERMDYPSIAAFVREACLAYAHQNDPVPLFTRIYEAQLGLLNQIRTLRRLCKEFQNEHPLPLDRGDRESG